ncbi:MAG TPA: hypothetical protein VGR28_10455 [Candidatus Thermoplasmatota archaeon]|jgi:hypothetical protein|nr:hypothetical protein [Candidatus Thermoplasmatota archaeon]
MVSLALASSLTSLAVGLIALALAALALRARRSSGNRQLGFVAAAFALFAVKSAFSSYDVLTEPPHLVPHDELELVLSLFDLVIIVLLVVPLLVKK